MPQIVKLTKGDLSLEVIPQIGGCIAAFRLGDFDLMRPMPADAIAEGNVRKAASYPLVPFSNRIADGRFTFGGKTYDMAPNTEGSPHAIHGLGWQSVWTARDNEGADLMLYLEHNPATAPAGAWPFGFVAHQYFTLTENTLRMGLHIGNTHSGMAPVGLGMHPFFLKRPGTKLQFAAADVWQNNDRKLPHLCQPTPPEWDFSATRAIGATIVDNCFTHWQGDAEIWHEPEGVKIAITATSNLRNAVFFVPPGRDDFAFEPVSHVNNALNLDLSVEDGAMSAIPFGAVLTEEITFSVSRT
jgi:aldose 1-epimerase